VVVVASDLDPAGTAERLAGRGGGARWSWTGGSRQAAAATSTRRHDVAHQELALEPHGVTRAAAIAAAALASTRSSDGSPISAAATSMPSARPGGDRDRGDVGPGPARVATLTIFVDLRDKIRAFFSDTRTSTVPRKGIR
jgi:hypothetical protein